MIETALELTKARIGISTNVRDTYLKEIVKSIVTELKDNNNIKLDETNSYHLMFVVDWATWRYLNRDHQEGMPRHLQYRLHNMVISNLGGGSDEV